MIIVHRLDDFLTTLFPDIAQLVELGADRNQLIAERLTDYYTFEPFRPKVKITGDTVEIHLDTRAISSQKPDFDKAVRLCERGEFRQAVPLFESLIRRNPTVSEYHRILGQVRSELGDQDGAIDALLDALRWDPRNSHALIMLGNVYARHRQDVVMASRFYNQALALNPNDHLAINNVASNLLKLGRFTEAQRYLELARDLNPTYPNTHYGLALAQQEQGNYGAAFAHALDAMRYAASSDPLSRVSLQLATTLARERIRQVDELAISDAYRQQLEVAGGKPVRFEEDPSIPTAAKLEIAENHGRDHHIVRYKAESAEVEHLIMHELVHLDLILQARAENTNQLFTTTSAMKQRFIRTAEPQLRKLEKEGYGDASIAGFVNSLFDGINRQIYNTPLDLFIEDFLFDEFPDLRPLQFLSLLKLHQEYVQATQHKSVAQLVPPFVRHATIVLNLVQARQVRELFGYDAPRDFKAAGTESRLADKFWQEYLEYRRDREPGEEYELVRHWGQDLKLADYFNLVSEEEYRRQQPAADAPLSSAPPTASATPDRTPEELLEAIERDPLGFEEPTPADAIPDNRVSFSDNPAGDMAVMFYCLDALQYFASHSPEDRVRVTHEIAILGRSGLNPGESERKYKLASVPGKTFSALQLLAWMYTGFQEIAPDLDTGLDFAEPLRMARAMFGKS